MQSLLRFTPQRISTTIAHANPKTLFIGIAFFIEIDIAIDIAILIAIDIDIAIDIAILIAIDIVFVLLLRLKLSFLPPFYSLPVTLSFTEAGVRTKKMSLVFSDKAH